MDHFKLRLLIADLRRIVDELESEVYSDPSKYLQDVVSGIQVEDDDGEAD